MKTDITEVVKLEAINTTDYKIIDKSTGKEVGFLLRKVDAKLGFELHPYFDIPDGVSFPNTATTLLEAFAIFNRTYRKFQSSSPKS
jgi:hypothetical protein